MSVFRFIAVSLLPLTFLLAACGGSDSPTAVPTSAPEAAENADDSPQLGAIGGGTFSYSVSGSQELTIDEGQGVVVRDPGMEVAGMDLPARIEIMLTSGAMSSELYQVLITTPPDTGTGTYELTDTSLSEAGFTAEFSYVNVEDMDGFDYAWDISGTLTLTETGDQFSGSFEFSASSDMDDADSVTVSGSFSDLMAYDADYDE